MQFPVPVGRPGQPAIAQNEPAPHAVLLVHVGAVAQLKLVVAQKLLVPSWFVRQTPTGLDPHGWNGVAHVTTHCPLLQV
jgi:hypothetical protein